MNGKVRVIAVNSLEEIRPGESLHIISQVLLSLSITPERHFNDTNYISLLSVLSGPL